MTAELLSLLAPDATDPAKLEACVELVRSLARGAVEAGEDFDLDLARAEVEYEQEVRATAVELCGKLFHLHLASMARGPESPRGSGLEPWRAPKGRARGAWTALFELEGRGLDLALPGLPEPGEDAAAVAARILAAAECLGVDAGMRSLWRAHLTAVDQGPLAGEAAYRELIEVGDELPFELLESAHAGLLGCLLSRGAVRRAADWVETHMDLAAVSERLMRFAGWAQLALGDLDAAEEYLSPMPRAGLPGPIAALGDRLPGLRGLLGGTSEWSTDEPAATVAWSGLRRRDVGAAALCLVELEGPRARLVHAELAPGLEGPDTAWVDRQEVAPFEEGEPESALLKSQELVVVFPDPEGDLEARRWARGCLSGRTRGLALVPLFRQGGRRLAGWIRVEFEHLLVPEDARLERLAMKVGKRLGFGAVRPLPLPPLCPGAPRLFEDALTGFGLGRRRWWGFAVRGAELEVLASGGTSLDDWEERPGGRGLVRACLHEQRPLPRGQKEHELVHRDSRAGLAIPLGIGSGTPRFALAIESTRAGDLGPDDVTALAEGRRGDLRGLGAALEAAAFNQAHRELHGEELAFTPWAQQPCQEQLLPLLLDDSLRDAQGSPAPLEELERLRGGPLLLVGPPGSGKRTLARFLAFREGAELEELRARGLDRRRLREVLRRGGRLLIRDLEDLDQEQQVLLLEAFESGHGQGLACTTRQVVSELGLWTRLADHLESRIFRVPGLSERRAELPDLFEVGLRRAARRQGTLPPALTPEARSLIWRQAWSKGLHGLLDLSRRLVPLAHGQELDAAELLRLAADLGWQLVAKLDSRKPDLAALWQALDGTRKQSGSFHRGRAAALMGWDPDTMTACLKRLRG